MSPTSPWTTGTPNILWIHKLGTFLYEEWLRSEWLFFPFIFLSVLYWGALDKCTTSTYSSSLEYAAFCPFSLTRGRKDTVEFSLNPHVWIARKSCLPTYQLLWELSWFSKKFITPQIPSTFRELTHFPSFYYTRMLGGGCGHSFLPCTSNWKTDFVMMKLNALFASHGITLS